MISLQLLGTAWTVWNLTRKRLGPVGALLVTAVVVGGLVYIRPRLTERAPALAGAVMDVERGEDTKGGENVKAGEDAGRGGAASAE